jgi:hypothetical protein
MKTSTRLIIFPVMLAMLSVTACTDNKPNKHPIDKTPVTSCNTLSNVNVASLTPQEQTDVCNIMVADIKRQPPAYLLHDFLVLVSLIKETAADETANLIAIQAMDIIKTRQQENNDMAIQNSFDTIWQVYQNTQTQISLEDLNGMLKKSGDAKHISDETLTRAGIALWEQKNNAKEQNVIGSNKRQQTAPALQS